MLTCVYMLTLDHRYVRMATMSLLTLRRFDPSLRVELLVVGGQDEATAAGAKRLFALADAVKFVIPTHDASGYFQDNVSHLSSLTADQVVYLDADTLIFGSVQALAQKLEHLDIAGLPSAWIWDHGYRRSYAPDIVAPFNGGVLSMSSAFCKWWSADAAPRHKSILHDPDRSELVRWMHGVSPSAYHRHEFVLSESAWSGSWAVGVLGPEDCYLLARWPEDEDPVRWTQSTVFHTYTQTWDRCIERLRGVCDLPCVS